MLEEHAMRDWVWQALDTLPPDERVTVMLRYFARCTSYEAIAHVTAVPIGTVRSRLNRARSRLADALMATVSGTMPSRAALEAAQRDQWQAFYHALHERPLPRTYRDLFVPDIDVRDTAGHWVGTREWSAHERKAITLGVRATIVALLASRNLTILEIDFTNPPTHRHHCPPQATFVHLLDDGRSRNLRIHYPVDQPLSVERK
jgi:RNA polymerase sigma-70 factor (ECF subfamily)